MNKARKQPIKQPLICGICHQPIDEAGPDKRHHLGSLEDGMAICARCCSDINDHDY